MSDITAVIRKKTNDHVRDTGLHVSTVYLGEYEMFALKYWLYANEMKDITEEDLRGETDQPPTLFGMRLYKVATQSHIGFSSEAT